MGAPAKDPQALIDQWLPGGYRVRKLVGSGAFAWVYSATSTGGQIVAIKVLQSESVEARTMFTREIKVLRQLPANDYCVRYLDDGATEEGYPFLAMEYIDGCTLKDAFRFKPQWEVEEACTLMLQLCASLIGLHGLGVAHRDLKPENVMLTQEWQVKLTDFGLVKDAQGLLKLFETEDILTGRDFAENIDRAMLAGTPEYMAPEQFLDPMEEDETKAQTDTWSDVYSLGLIFTQLLTGEKLFPFVADNSSQPAYARSLLRYVRDRTSFEDRALTRPGTMPTRLWPVVAKALKQDPRRRFHTAGEFYDAIQDFLDTGGSEEFVEEEHTRMADMSAMFAQFAASDESGARRVSVRAAAGDAPASNRPQARRSDSMRPQARSTSVFPQRPEPSERSAPVDIAAVQAYREGRLNAPGAANETLPPGTVVAADVYARAGLRQPTPAPESVRLPAPAALGFDIPPQSANPAWTLGPAHAIPPPSMDVHPAFAVPPNPALPLDPAEAARAPAARSRSRATLWTVLGILSLLVAGGVAFAVAWMR